MKKYSIKISLALAALLLAACSPQARKQDAALPYYQDASFTPAWLDKNNEELAAFHKIPAFSLTNQFGQTITDKTINGKITVADFFFTTCPGICPKMTKNMGLVERQFLDDTSVIILSHSVTPDIDSVPTLAAYAKRKNIASPQWHLLTGNRDEIYKLGRKAYFVEEDLGEQKSNDDFLHTENFVLLDGNRHIRGIYNGLNKASIAQLIADIQTLKEE